jgi:hypothetical protein
MKLWLVIVVIIPILVACSPSRPRTDWSRLGLLGAPRMVSNQSQVPPAGLSNWFFNQAGNLTENRFEASADNPDELVGLVGPPLSLPRFLGLEPIDYRELYHYDANGLVDFIQRLDRQGGVLEVERIINRQDGYPVETERRDASGRLIGSRTFEYDGKGNLILTKVLNDQNSMRYWETRAYYEANVLLEYRLLRGDADGEPQTLVTQHFEKSGRKSTLVPAVEHHDAAGNLVAVQYRAKNDSRVLAVLSRVIEYYQP